MTPIHLPQQTPSVWKHVHMCPFSHLLMASEGLGSSQCINEYMVNRENGLGAQRLLSAIPGVC